VRKTSFLFAWCQFTGCWSVTMCSASFMVTGFGV
jgi:hypothetical protein